MPLRIQSFLWKVATKALPTLSRLRERYVDVDLICPICNDAIENDCQALLGCSFVYPIWDDLFGEGWPINITNLDDWWSWVISKNNDKIARVSSTPWAIWARRNNFILKNSFRPHHKS